MREPRGSVRLVVVNIRLPRRDRRRTLGRCETATIQGGRMGSQRMENDRSDSKSDSKSDIPSPPYIFNHIEPSCA